MRLSLAHQTSFSRQATAEEIRPIDRSDRAIQIALQHSKHLGMGVPEARILKRDVPEEFEDRPVVPVSTRSMYDPSRVAEHIMRMLHRGDRFWRDGQDAFDGITHPMSDVYGCASEDQKVRLARILQSYGMNIKYEATKKEVKGKANRTGQLEEPDSDEVDSESEADPESGNLYTEDNENWYQYGKLYLSGTRTDLARQMIKDQFFPAVFWISDHGNLHDISPTIMRSVNMIQRHLKKGQVPSNPTVEEPIEIENPHATQDEADAAAIDVALDLITDIHDALDNVSDKGVRNEAKAKLGNLRNFLYERAEGLETKLTGGRN